MKISFYIGAIIGLFIMVVFEYFMLSMEDFHFLIYNKSFLFVLVVYNTIVAIFLGLVAQAPAR